jgi:hypothetical protein
MASITLQRPAPPAVISRATMSKGAVFLPAFSLLALRQMHAGCL